MPKRRYWTEEEDQIIRRNEGMAPDELVKLLPGRTVLSLRTRRYNLRHLLGEYVRHREPTHAEGHSQERKPGLPVNRKPFSYNPTPCMERELG